MDGRISLPTSLISSIVLLSALVLCSFISASTLFYTGSLKTAFQSEIITNFMKPHLENLTISDENLILHLDEAISEEEERQAKLAFRKKSKTVVSEANCDDNKGKTDQHPKSASGSPLLAAVEGFQAQVAEIGGTVKLLQKSTGTTS